MTLRTAVKVLVSEGWDAEEAERRLVEIVRRLADTNERNRWGQRINNRVGAALDELLQVTDDENEMTHRGCGGQIAEDPTVTFDYEPGDGGVVVQVPAVFCARCGEHIEGDAQIDLSNYVFLMAGDGLP